MTIKTSIIAFAATMLLLISMEPAEAQKSRKLMMAGYKMDPPVGTSASGMVTVTLHQDTLSVKGDFSNLMSQFYGAYIMAEIRGQAGNVLYRLKAELDKEKTSGKFCKKKNSFALSPQGKAMLREGRLFLTVSSYDHKRGEIRVEIPSMK